MKKIVEEPLFGFEIQCGGGQVFNLFVIASPDPKYLEDDKLSKEAFEQIAVVLELTAKAIRGGARSYEDLMRRIPS